jgi:hypothetical protein
MGGCCCLLDWIVGVAVAVIVVVEHELSNESDSWWVSEQLARSVLCVRERERVRERFSHTRWVSRLFNLKLHRLKSLAEIAHLPSAPVVQR